MDNRAVVSCFNGFLRRIQHFIFASYWSKEQVQLHSGRQRYKPTGIFSLAKWRVLPSIFRIWRSRLSNRKRVRQNHSRCRWTESRLSWSGSCSAVRNVCCLFIWLIEWLDFRHGNGRLRVRCLLIRSVNSAYANGKQIKTYPLFQHGTRNNQYEKRLSWYANLENWYLVYPFICYYLINFRLEDNDISIDPQVFVTQLPVDWLPENWHRRRRVALFRADVARWAQLSWY